MSKFRYYITDLSGGSVKGTDSPEVAQDFIECEDYFVVDSHEGKWLTPAEALPIKDIQDRP